MAPVLALDDGAWWPQNPLCWFTSTITTIPTIARPPQEPPVISRPQRGSWKSSFQFCSGLIYVNCPKAPEGRVTGLMTSYLLDVPRGPPFSSFHPVRTKLWFLSEAAALLPYHIGHLDPTAAQLGPRAQHHRSFLTQVYGRDTFSPVPTASPWQMFAFLEASTPGWKLAQ